MEEINDAVTEKTCEIFQEIQNKCDENIDKLTAVNSNNIEITACIKEAHRIVDEVITNSSQYVIKLREEEEQGVVVESAIPNIPWITIEEFSVENGLQKIEEFIATWERGSGWLFCVDFLCEDICMYSKRYRYRVRWSIPTRRKPIPRATASVYFTIDVSDVMPKTHMVKVYYIFESSKLVHRPGESRFREKWLKDIVDAKISLMETVTF